jgi:hypothetical protein
LAQCSGIFPDLGHRPLGGRLRPIQINLMLHPGTDIGFMGQQWKRFFLLLNGPTLRNCVASKEGADAPTDCGKPWERL